MKCSQAIVAILLAAGTAVPAGAVDRATPVPARSGTAGVPSPLGTVGGIARPGDPNYRPGASVRPDRTFAPNRVGGVARPGDLGVAAPAVPDRPPAAVPDSRGASRMPMPQQSGPAARGRASGLGIDDPFARAGSGSGGPTPARAPR